MKLSDIVSVNINNVLENESTFANANMNATAAAIVFYQPSGSTPDTFEWKRFNDLINPENVTEIVKKTFFENGGRDLLIKEVPYSADNVTGFADIVYGSDVHEALPLEVVNIIVAGVEDQWMSQIVQMAEAVNGRTTEVVDGKTKETSRPEEEKLLFFNIAYTQTAKSTLKGLVADNVSNAYVNIYDINLTDRDKVIGDLVNNYETAVAAAYVTKISYNIDTIKGFEYTVINAVNAADINGMKNAPVRAGDEIFVNIVTNLVNRKLVIGGHMIDGSNFIAKYFSVILTQRLTKALTTLVVNKINFTNNTFATIANTLVTELDVFRSNGLFNTEFIVEDDEFAEVITAAGSQTFNLVRKGETLSTGYKVFTLPPSTNDLQTRTYSGANIFFAINNQIRRISVSGLMLGGSR